MRFRRLFGALQQISADEEANEQKGEGRVNGEANAHILNGLLAHLKVGREQIDYCSAGKAAGCPLHCTDGFDTRRKGTFNGYFELSCSYETNFWELKKNSKYIFKTKCLSQPQKLEKVQFEKKSTPKNGFIEQKIFKISPEDFLDTVGLRIIYGNTVK